MELCESSYSVQDKIKRLLFDHNEDDPEAEAIIIYPSFGAPLVSKPGQPLRLYVLFERELYFLYRAEHGSNPQVPRTIDVINKSLKVFKWENGKKNPRKLLFPSKAAARSNIRCHFIKLVSDRSIEDKDGKLFGYLRKKTNERYANHQKGFRYLFSLEIDNLGLGQGLYDCAWKLNDPKSAANSMKPPLPFPERQDLIALDFIKAGETGDNYIKQDTGYKIENEFNFTPDADLPLSNHHPIYITTKPKLNIGQLTDIHVSSRQMALKRCEAQVLPSAEERVSPKICSLVNVSFETFKDLLDQMGSDSSIDLLVLTGDLIDFNQNFDPTVASKNWQQDFKRPATMWRWMDPKRYNDSVDGKQPYPYYIDMLTIYSLLHDFVKRHKKPIVMLTGNHEAYAEPYGISPRVGQFWGLNPEGLSAANEGIPADHNLTVYEATLLYGPAYYDYRNIHNFEAKYLEWFYMMFNPLSDFTFTYEEQSFTALSWKDSEQFLSNDSGVTKLPRANEAVSDAQLKLLQESRKRGKDRILLTHFTIVSYAYNYQITTAGSVNYGNTLNFGVTKTNFKMSDYEEGTFLTNRKAVYDMLYDGAFTHVFSGHSHRAGYYVMTERNEATAEVKVQGHPIEEKTLSPTRLLKNGKVRLIVGASGGPIPGQNHYQDAKEIGLFNWTLDRPSGNVLKFDGAHDTLCLKPTRNTKAKPRFAVALSYFNTTGIGKSKTMGVFQRFESNKAEGEFEIELHSALPGERFIDEIVLYVYRGGKWLPYPANVADNGQSKLKASFNSEEWLALRKRVLDSQSRNRKTFLKVAFNKKLANRTGYNQYNYDSTWTFPISMIDKQKEARKADAMLAASDPYGMAPIYSAQDTSGYRVEQNGEVPDFAWYRETFSDYRSGRPAELSRVDDESFP